MSLKLFGQCIDCICQLDLHIFDHSSFSKDKRKIHAKLTRVRKKFFVDKLSSLIESFEDRLSSLNQILLVPNASALSNNVDNSHISTPTEWTDMVFQEETNRKRQWVSINPSSVTSSDLLNESCRFIKPRYY